MDVTLYYTQLCSMIEYRLTSSSLILEHAILILPIIACSRALPGGELSYDLSGDLYHVFYPYSNPTPHHHIFTNSNDFTGL